MPTGRAVMKLVALCTLLPWGVCSGQAVFAATLGLGNIIPGAGLVSKKVVSIREARYAGLVPQQTDFSCGAAALATLLKYLYRMETSEARVMAGMLGVADPEVVRNRGFSLLDIKHYVQTLGMRGRGYNLNIRQLEHTRIPTIALLDIKGYKHFVVLKKITPEHAYVADPALGNRVLPRTDFLAGWNGVVFAVIGRGLDRNSVLLHPAEPLTARRLMTTLAPLNNAELLDFGFTHAELF